MQHARVSDKWVKRFEGSTEQRSSSYNNTANGEHSKLNLLQMSWAIPERMQRRLNKTRKTFLNQLFDNCAKSGNKITAEKAEQRIPK